MYVHIHETIFASGVVHINIKFYHRLFIGIEATSPSIVFLIRVSIQTSYFICPKQLNNNFTSNRMKIRTPLSLHRHSRMQLLCVDATDCISSLGSPGWNKHKKWNYCYCPYSGWLCSKRWWSIGELIKWRFFMTRLRFLFIYSTYLCLSSEKVSWGLPRYDMRICWHIVLRQQIRRTINGRPMRTVTISCSPRCHS